MARLGLAFASLVAAGCASTAPHTLASAAVNTGVAMGAATASRAAGGCYSACSPGYTCNPGTGFCELLAPVCAGETNDPRCPPPTPVPLGTSQEAARAADAAYPVGLSPATGRAPPLPGDRQAP